MRLFFPISTSPLSILTRSSIATSPNPTPATSRHSPASSVYPRNILSSICESNVSRDSSMTGLLRLQTGTDERQERRMRAAATHLATHTPTPFSPSTSPSSSAFPKSSPARFTTSRATDRAGSYLAHAHYLPYSQRRIHAPCVQSRTVPYQNPSLWLSLRVGMEPKHEHRRILRRRGEGSRR